MPSILLAPSLTAVLGFASSGFAQDTDGDGLSDADEAGIYGSDPNSPDSDGDTLEDGDEVANGTSPISTDTDQDGLADQLDNCPSAYNPLQVDSGTIASTDLDGVGDLCQNFDIDPGGVVDIVDITLARRALAGLEPDTELAMPPRSPPFGCENDPSTDGDSDSFTGAGGDCNDCNAAVNPAAFDIAGNLVDDDCDGTVDNGPPACDSGLALASALATDAANALDLCKLSSGPGDWGLVSASWTQADGAPPPASGTPLANYELGHGLVDSFGGTTLPHKGSRMLLLSSGTARRPTDPGFVAPASNGFDKGLTGNAPPGFPVETAACPGVVTGPLHDPAALELVLRAPSNAVGYGFDFRFYTAEWPDFICDTFNDFFLAIQIPAPAGSLFGDVSFDALANPVSVNAGFLEVCGPPGVHGGKNFTCPQGTSSLVGTGFETHGGTGWLTTTVPVSGGDQITLRLTVYDSGDGLFDSSVLIDNFRWVADPVGGPGTMP